MLTRSSAVLLLALLQAAPASAQPTPNTVIPLYGRVLGFNLPPGFVAQPPKSNGTNFLMEFVPKGETVENWTRLVTVQAFRGAGRQPTASADIAKAAFDPQACVIGRVYLFGGEQTVQGALKRSLIVSGCGSLPAGAYPKAMKGASERDAILFFRDADTLYTLNYAERSPLATKVAPFTLASATAKLTATFGNVRLCANAAEPGCKDIIAINNARRAAQ
ncbi:hypothetical protein [Sphingopyxis sp.]|uniref:hypothetical protein n=1 Tax=Sphingopyxis sp. TaxID=1908224 RepID=UPI003BAD6FED